MSATMKPELIAPCGMNCRLCVAYLRKRKPCGGCNGSDEHKPHHCVVCAIKHCPTQTGFCHACGAYPCKRLKSLDNRYRTKYGMSMLENLDYVNRHGMEAFLALEAERRACLHCGESICVHRAECPHCGKPIAP